MTRIDIWCRTALGAIAIPALAKAEPASDVRVIIQYGVSYLLLMMNEGTNLAEQGDSRIEVKLQMVGGSTAVGEGFCSSRSALRMQMF